MKARQPVHVKPSVNKKLCEQSPNTRRPRVLHQTAWFISIYFGKLVGETQRSFTEVVKKSMLYLIETAEKP